MLYIGTQIVIFLDRASLQTPPTLHASLRPLPSSTRLLSRLQYLVWARLGATLVANEPERSSTNKINSSLCVAASWEKKIKDLQSKIDELSKKNDDLRIGRDATMTDMDPTHLPSTSHAESEALEKTLNPHNSASILKRKNSTTSNNKSQPYNQALTTLKTTNTSLTSEPHLKTRSKHACGPSCTAVWAQFAMSGP